MNKKIIISIVFALGLLACTTDSSSAVFFSRLARSSQSVWSRTKSSAGALCKGVNTKMAAMVTKTDTGKKVTTVAVILGICSFSLATLLLSCSSPKEAAIRLSVFLAPICCSFANERQRRKAQQREDEQQRKDTENTVQDYLKQGCSLAFIENQLSDCSPSDIPNIQYILEEIRRRKAQA